MSYPQNDSKLEKQLKGAQIDEAKSLVCDEASMATAKIENSQFELDSWNYFEFIWSDSNNIEVSWTS